MAVARVQAPALSSGSGSSFVTGTLGTTPTVGNVLVVDIQTNYLASNPALTGWTMAYAPAALSSADYAQMWRVVQSGDTGGPYTFSGNQSGYAYVCKITEYSGAGASPSFTYNSANVTWASNSETTPSLSATAGSLAEYVFPISTYGSYSTSGDSVSPGTYETSLSYYYAAGTNGIYCEFGYQSFSSSGTASSTGTMPNVTSSGSTQSAIVWVLAAGGVTVTITMSETGPGISDSIGAPPAVTAPITLSETGPTISDSLSVSGSGGSAAFITITDNGPTISDSISTAVAVAMTFLDTGPAISDGITSGVAGALSLSDTGPNIYDAIALGIVLPTIFFTDTGPSISDSIHVQAFLVVPEIGNAANPGGMIGNGQYVSGDLGNGPSGHLEGG